jgi:hypothetical protein
MGLVESTLRSDIVKPIVRPDTMTLPSLTIDACKFTNGSFGFVIEITDLAKNTTIYNVSLKSIYSPIENVYTYVGHNQTILSFSKNRLTGSAYCILHMPNFPGPIVCDCLSSYEAIGDERIDQLITLFQRSS